MQGKATLILADAKTGREIKCVEEHNMFTNAIKNIFAPPMYAVMHSFDYTNFITQATPMWKNYLGGVMLLGSRVEEDPDNIMANGSLAPVATAGSPYAGNSTVRGTYNENESYPIENGYRLTWDFATDKANGTIRCVALTSKMFGNTGFWNSGSDGGVMIVPDSGNIYSYSSASPFEYGTGQYVGTFEPRTHLFVNGETIGGEYRLVFRKYRSPNPNGLLINDRLGLKEMSQPIYEHAISPTVDFTNDSLFFVDPENRLIYYFGKFINQEDGPHISYMAIDIDTLEVAQTKEITLEYENVGYSYYVGAVYKGRLYLMTNSRVISEFSESGKWIRDHNSSTENFSALTAFNGSIISMTFGKNYFHMYQDTGEDLMLYSTNTGHVPGYSVDFRPPYYPLLTLTTHFFYTPSPAVTRPGIGIMSNYMATINNLAEPLVKTSEHTLKIRYDITQ